MIRNSTSSVTPARHSKSGTFGLLAPRLSRIPVSNRGTPYSDSFVRVSNSLSLKVLRRAGENGSDGGAFAHHRRRRRSDAVALRPNRCRRGCSGGRSIDRRPAQRAHPLEWFLFTTLVILTGSFTLNVSAINASISVADTFLIASTLLFGPAPATVALALDTFVLSWRKGYPWRRVAFNAVAPALSLWVAGHVFFLITGAAPLAANDAKIGPLIPALFLLATIYFALNSGLIAMAVGLESRRSPFKIWYDHFLWLSIGYLAAASVGLGLIVILRQVGLAAVAMMLPVVAIFHHTLRASFGRLEDARRHVTQIDRLYHSTVETLAMAIDAKDDVTHSHVRRVQAYAAALARELGSTTS